MFFLIQFPVLGNEIKETEKKVINTIINGKVDFLKQPSDSVVSLIITPNYTNPSASKIIAATGVSDTSGNFSIDPGISFFPIQGEIFILEASKKIPPDGKNKITLRTFIQWKGNGWDSISFPGIIINSGTTAMAMMSDYNPFLLHSADTIKKIELINNESELKGTGSLINSEKILEVAYLVKQAISNNLDPSTEIKYQPEFYYSENNTGIKEKVTFRGKVYNSKGIPVDRVKVIAKSIDPGINWVGTEQISNNGSYIFKDAPVLARIQITASKDGWTTRSRTEILKSNLARNSEVNVFDFIGFNSVNDEPEILEIKINGKKGTSPGSETKPEIPGEFSPSNLTGISNSSLEIDLTFSEPVNKEDVENNLKIISQPFSINNNQNFTIDKNVPGVSFSWDEDESRVIFKTNKKVLSNITGKEARYTVSFSNPFRDKTGKQAVSEKFIRFSNTKSSDFLIFSVTNDIEEPALLSISSQVGKDSNNLIQLNFNKTLEVINQTSFSLCLADPADPSNIEKQMFVTSTNNPNGNNATVLGYSSSLNAAENTPDFKAVFMIGKIVSGNGNSETPKIEPLVGISNPSQIQKSNGLLISAKISKDILTLELAPGSFKKDDIIIISIGKPINTSYFEKVKSMAPMFLTVDAPGITFAEVKDPSGKVFSQGNEISDLNFMGNNIQKIGIAN